ncbi:MAG: hypothetical protein ACR2MW_08945 [Chthoniobacterales bacterium]
MATSSQTILWLVPAEPARTFFHETIIRLATEYDAPLFEPHLTLGSGTPAQLLQVNAGPITLAILGLDTSASFTKTLFVRFQPTPPLVQLRYSLGMEAAGYAPHVSLLYRQLSDPIKSDLAAGLSLPFPSVTFNAVAAIRCPAEVATRADVEAWETVAAKTLA